MTLKKQLDEQYFLLEFQRVNAYWLVPSDVGEGEI